VIVNTVINRIYVEFCPGGTDNYVDYLNYGRLNWICAEFAMTGYLDLRVCCSNYNQMKTEFMLSNSIFFWRDSSHNSSRNSKDLHLASNQLRRYSLYFLTSYYCPM
jgi:hypothetical protein